jgi:hypothetical protein
MPPPGRGVSPRRVPLTDSFRLSKGTFAAAYSAYDDLLHVICVKEDRSMIWISYSNPKTSLDNFKTGTLPGKAADGTRIAVVAKSAERGKPETYAESCLFYQDAATPDHLNTMSYEISKADWTASESNDPLSSIVPSGLISQ